MACNQGDYLLLIAGLGGVMALLILVVTILRLVLTLYGDYRETIDHRL